MESIGAVHFSKCRSIEPVLNEDVSGLICKSNYCMRNCKDGFKPKRPKKVRQYYFTQIFSMDYAYFQTICKKGQKEYYWSSKGVPTILGGCVNNFMMRNMTEDEAYLYRMYRINPRRN